MIYNVHDPGYTKKGAQCYIQGNIKIIEYLVDSSNYQLWDCFNCKYNENHNGQIKKYSVSDVNKLNCGKNNNK